MALSCVQRMYRKLGYHLGAAQVCAVLKGSKRKRLTELVRRTEEERRRQGKVYQVLGLSGGAFLIILLL